MDTTQLKKQINKIVEQHIRCALDEINTAIDWESNGGIEELIGISEDETVDVGGIKDFSQYKDDIAKLLGSQPKGSPRDGLIMYKVNHILWEMQMFNGNALCNGTTQPYSDEDGMKVVKMLGVDETSLHNKAYLKRSLRKYGFKA